jgi:hypothetical protein
LCCSGSDKSESDDEEEFQNENIDRFVDMHKTVYMICKFNYKFKKWYPVKEVITLKQELVDKNELLDYEKNNPYCFISPNGDTIDWLRVSRFL